MPCHRSMCPARHRPATCLLDGHNHGHPPHPGWPAAAAVLGSELRCVDCGVRLSMGDFFYFFLGNGMAFFSKGNSMAV